MNYKESADKIVGIMGLELSEAFRSQVESQFKIDRDERFNRAPPMGLRLYGDDGMISLSFDYSRQHKDVRTDVQHVEVLTDVEFEFESKKYYRGHVGYRCRLSPDRVTIQGSLYPKRVFEAAESFRDIAQAFIDDPAKVVGKCTNQCCICGRALTDGSSRSRGIGPECMNRFPNLGFATPLFGSEA